MAEDITQPLDRHEQASLGKALRERFEYESGRGLPLKLETLMAALRSGDGSRPSPARER